MRGTFANIRLRNLLVPGIEGGVTMHLPDGDADVDLRRRRCSTSARACRSSILAGKEYGSGSSRDWAAKGTLLLGVRAVIAESFERIHRSNLVGMGVLPLQFQRGRERRVARADRTRGYRRSIGVKGGIVPRGTLAVTATGRGRHRARFTADVAHRHARGCVAFSHGGILPYVLRQLARARVALGLAAMSRGHVGARLAETSKPRRSSLGFDLCGICRPAAYPELALPCRVAEARLRRRHGVSRPHRRAPRATCATSCRRRSR